MVLLKKLLYMRFGITALTISISIISILISLWWNAQISTIINSINTGYLISTKTLLLASVTMLISAGMAYTLSICSSWVCESLTHDLRMGYARYFTTLSLCDIENLNAGEQLSKLQNEITDVSGFLNANLFTIVDDIVRFIATFSWLLWLNPKLTVLAYIPNIIIIGYTVYSSKIIGKVTHLSQQANAEMNGFTDTLTFIFPILRLFDATHLIQEKYNTALEKWENTSIAKESKRAKLMSLSAFMSYIPLVLLFIIGGTQILHKMTTLGTLYIFINLSGNVSGVMMNMPGRIGLFRGFSVNMKRLEPFVSLETGRQ